MRNNSTTNTKKIYVRLGFIGRRKLGPQDLGSAALALKRGSFYGNPYMRRRAGAVAIARMIAWNQWMDTGTCCRIDCASREFRVMIAATILDSVFLRLDDVLNQPRNFLRHDVESGLRVRAGAEFDPEFRTVPDDVGTDGGTDNAGTVHPKLE